jgi:hypothetical protein
MKGTQFEQFSREVLRRGAPAVLPQHLSDRWLDALLEEAERFTSGGEDAEDKGDAEEEETCEEEGDVKEQDSGDDIFTGLLGAVLALLMEQQEHPDKLEIATRTLFQHMNLYILALTAETISRRSDIWLEPPTVANIFDPERAVRARRRDAADS